MSIEYCHDCGNYIDADYHEMICYGTKVVCLDCWDNIVMEDLVENLDDVIRYANKVLSIAPTPGQTEAHGQLRDAVKEIQK